MKLIAKPEPFAPKHLEIKAFHRIALGLESHTRIFLAALPPQAGQVSEMILSTLHPKDWQHLYRLTAVLHEGQGVVAEVLELLRSRKVNINIIETLTTENTKSHEILAVLTLAHDPKRVSTLTKALRRHLQKTHTITHEQDLDILPFRRLRDAAQQRAAHKMTAFVETEIVDGVVQTTLDDWRRLFHLPDGSHGLDGYSQVVMFSDTEEKYLSFYFPPSSDCLLRIGVKHVEKTGALAAFTATLQPLRINIVNSYSRLQQSGQAAEWRATLDVTHATSCHSFIERTRDCTPFFEEFLKLSVHYTPQRASRSLTPDAFCYESGLTDLTMFQGREDERREITSERRHFLISGYYKTGKSSLLAKVAEQLSLESKMLPVLIHLKGTANDDFFRVIIRRLWAALASIGAKEAPVEARPFLPPRTASTPSLRVGDPAELHDLSRIPPVTELRDRIDSAIRALVVQATQNGKQGFTVLLDEAQEVLYSPRQGGGEDLRAIWAYLRDEIPVDQLQWVVSDSKHWRHTEPGVSNITSKLKVLVLGPLEAAAAERLIVEPFERHKIYPATQRVIDRLLSLAGRQPCYIQALCEQIIKRLEYAPPAVDIITEDLVDDVVRPTVESLHVHFEQMYSDLLEVLNPDAFADVLARTPNATVGRRVLVNSRAADRTSHPSSLTLDAIPGLVRSDAASASQLHRAGAIARKSVDAAANRVPVGHEDIYAVTELFYEWARRHGPGNLSADGSAGAATAG